MAGSASCTTRTTRSRRRCSSRRRWWSAASEHADVVVATGLGQARNVLLVRSADAVIAVGGSWGTLSEVAIARRLGRPVVWLHGWAVDGPADPVPTVETPEAALAWLAQ